MDRNVNIRKTVYRKEQFDKVVDRRFKTFKQPEPTPQKLTIAEFFEEYKNLFYEIPAEGDTGSHRYLINQSSQLVNIEQDTEDIEPLLNEIAQLREQMLEQQQEIIDLNQELAELKNKLNKVG